MPPADFAAASREISAKTKREPRDEDVLSYLLYPQVYLEFQKHWLQFGDTSTIPTANFFFGLQPGDETSIEIERGKTLFVKYLTTGEVREDGTRTVFFELNGQPRPAEFGEAKYQFVAKNAKGETVNRTPGIGWIGGCTDTNEFNFLQWKALTSWGVPYRDTQARV